MVRSSIEDDMDFIAEILWEDGYPMRRVRGVDLLEWLLLADHGYDEVDAAYVDAETIGGA
jgi:hypothetical protein